MNEFSTIEQDLARMSVQVVFVASLIIAALVLIAVLVKKQSELAKNILFWGLTLVITVTTLVLAGSTVYLNAISVTAGPVHWHADYEIWACGERLDLVNPTGLSNKIGTQVLHEHNDDRIHLEGVVVQPRDASLGKFWHVIGAAVEDKKLVWPSDQGELVYSEGQLCNGEPADVQMFLIQIEQSTNEITQRKLTDFGRREITRSAQVPPGDCVIVEFDVDKQLTDKLCRSYQVAKELGKIHDSN